jgi:hypothetical protein
MDINSLVSPRSELIAILQREHDEAMALLDANPFITGLLIKYSRGGAAKSSSAENEELVALRAANNSIRQDYERLRTDFETVKQQKKAAETISVGLEIQLASSVEQREKDSKEIEILKGSLKDTEAELWEAQDRLASNKVRLLPLKSKRRHTNKTFSSKQRKIYQTLNWSLPKRRKTLPRMPLRML